MEITRRSCRLCLSESDFNASLFGTYCRRINMVEKIFVCLKIIIEENDTLNTICFKCAESIERYYNFIMFVKKSQLRFAEPRHELNNSPIKRHHITSYVREQVYDADYTFSFLEIPNEEKKENKSSSPFFSYFSPPNGPLKRSAGEPSWKTPRPLCDNIEKKNDRHLKRQSKPELPRHHSRDLFESQSQEVDEECRTFDWKLTPDDNIIKRIRGKCFKQSDF